MLKAYKYRLLPTKAQEEQLNKFFGCVRFVYNLGLETKIQAWKSANKRLNYIDLYHQLQDLKKTDAKWLSECPLQCMVSGLRNLDAAYGKFFKGAGYPKFKKKGGAQSVQFASGVKIKGDKVFIPKIRLTDFVQHRKFGDGLVRTTTVSKTTSGKYFISILVDNKKGLPSKKSISESSAIGIDVGLKTFAVLSDGELVQSPKYLERQLKRLRIEQRKLKRRLKRGVPISQQSKGYMIQKIVVAKLNEKIANRRKDFLHKLSTSIVTKYDTICLENLNVRGLQKNRGVARSIADSGWYTFTEMLRYKSDWYGKNFIKIGRFEPSSKSCSNCGYYFKDLELSHRSWVCDGCGAEHDRDINAAKNIKNFGLRDKPVIAKVSHKAML